MGHGSFVLVGTSNLDKMLLIGPGLSQALAPPPARLAVGPRTKASIGPWPNRGQDKCEDQKPIL